MRPVCVVLNPTAARGQAGKRLSELSSTLAAHGFAAEICTTEQRGHGTELATKAVREGAQVVVAAGGDGTVHEVAQAIVNTDAALGIIPMGSGNDYVRTLGIPRNLRGAVATLQRGTTRVVDVAEINGMYSLNSVGLGIDGQIAATFQRMRYLKRHVGYLYSLLLEIARFRGFRVEVVGDSWQTAGTMLSLSVMNGSFCGGGYRLAKQARLDDGILDIGLIGDYPYWMRFMLFHRVRTGTYLKLARVQSQRTQRITIRSNRPLPLHVDGELLPEYVQEVEVLIRPRALRVIA